MEPGEADVLGAAAAFVPAGRRARFEALYVALSQSSAGRSWSPAARAARALALAGRGDDTVTTARARAAAAWDVLPVVYPSTSEVAGVSAGSLNGEPEMGMASSASAVAAMMSSYASVPLGGLGLGTTRGGGPRATRGGAARDVVGAGSSSDQLADVAEMPHVSVSPGMAGLSARAGDALGAYVAPATPPAAPREQSSSTSSVGAVMRAPSAAPEYVQMGRSGGRHGGGEVEIPPWFEDAARRLLAERSGGDGISLAEMTLVTAAPASHVAASIQGTPRVVSA